MAGVARADLFLLKPGFEDPAFPGQIYFDRYSALLEGVIASFPILRDRLRVHRVEFERPRAEVAALAGEANQTLPRLVLPAGAVSAHAVSEHGGRQSIAGVSAVIAALVDLYGIVPPHP
ncbi:DUF3088 domain-containing protein [soil metagenome]